MRKLQSSDIFALCRVVNSLGIKDELKNIVNSINDRNTITKEIDYTAIGIDMICNIFEKAIQKKSENALFEFFANIFEMSTDEVKQLDPIDFINKIFEVADVERWKSFFLRLGSLMK